MNGSEFGTPESLLAKVDQRNLYVMSLVHFAFLLFSWLICFVFP